MHAPRCDQSNKRAGADTIVLQAETYLLTRVGTNEDAAFDGDLDINDSVTITGAGAASTIIDGNGTLTKERVIEILGGATTVSISDVTIQNGQSLNAGGGIASDGTLTLSNSRVSGNASLNDAGGGIYNIGTLTIIDSQGSGNMTGAQRVAVASTTSGS